MRHLISLSLIITGIIHLLPITGVLGAEKLAMLYGTSFDDPNLAILMRHRAVLFGLLGTLFVLAAFKPSLQPLSFVFGFVSVLSFLWLAWSTGNYSIQVNRIVIADLVALGSLIAGSAGFLYSKWHG